MSASKTKQCHNWEDQHLNNYKYETLNIYTIPSIEKSEYSLFLQTMSTTEHKYLLFSSILLFVNTPARIPHSQSLCNTHHVVNTPLK
jgi:hypothetical protein